MILHEKILNAFVADVCSLYLLNIWMLPATKQLHPEQSENHDEQEEQEEKTDDGLHGAHQRHDQVSQRGPVPEGLKAV